MSSEDQSRQSQGYSDCPKMANATFLPPDQQNVAYRAHSNTQKRDKLNYASRQHADISNKWKDHLSGMSCIRQGIINSGFVVDTTDIIMASWRDNTKDKYSTYINQ